MALGERLCAIGPPPQGHWAAADLSTVMDPDTLTLRAGAAQGEKVPKDEPSFSSAWALPVS